jgi:PTS system nitrogen regulatory IIA component
MNQIAQLLPPANILLDVDADSKSGLFDTLGALFEANHGLARRTVVGSLVAREKLGSTGLGQGLADAQGAFVNLAKPIAFDAPDAKPVSQIFVLLVPEQATERHLQLLSELAQMFSDRGFREHLAAAHTPAAVHALFTDWEPR